MYGLSNFDEIYEATIIGTYFSIDDLQEQDIKKQIKSSHVILEFGKNEVLLTSRAFDEVFQDQELTKKLSIKQATLTITLGLKDIVFKKTITIKKDNIDKFLKNTK